MSGLMPPAFGAANQLRQDFCGVAQQADGYRALFGGVLRDAESASSRSVACSSR